MKKIDGFKLIGVAALVLGGISTLLSEAAHEKEMKETVKEEVDRAFSEKMGES